MAESRSRNGCWTCLLRRKKCDEGRPQCQECKFRNLVCHGYGKKPSWMDGGARERAELASVKLAVSNGTQRRRLQSSGHQDTSPLPWDQPKQTSSGADCRDFTPVHRSKISSYRLTTSVTPISPTSDHDYGEGVLEMYDEDFSLPSDIKDPDLSSTHDGNITVACGTNLVSNFIPNSGMTYDIENSLSVPYSARLESFDGDAITVNKTDSSEPFNPMPNEIGQQGVECAFSAVATPSPLLSSRNTTLLIYYLENVFPWQFPFLASQGRLCHKGSLFQMILQSYPLRLAVLALSEYFKYGSSIQQGRFIAPVRNHLAPLYHAALQEIRLALQAHQETASDQSDSSWIIASIVMLTYTSVIQGENSWRVHIKAAIPMVLSYLGWKADRSTKPLESLPRSCDISKSQNLDSDPQRDDEGQASSFIIESIVWVHTLSSITDGKDSATDFAHLLEDENSGIQLGRLMGCQNWVLVCILRIQSLHRWKEEARASESLNIWELTQTAHTIGRKLSEGTDEMSRRFSKSRPNDGSITAPLVHFPPPPESLPDAITYIFICAAVIFLEVVVSGDFPRLPKVKEAVSRIIDALSLVQEPELLRILAWPLCVAGSMAETEHHAYFDNLVQTHSGRGKVMGNVLDLLHRSWMIRKEGYRYNEDSICWMDARRDLGADFCLI